MLLDRLIIKGNEIKEPGLFGKTVYVIKGNEIKEPGFFGKTVFVIKGNEIREPGLLGRTVYVIKGDEIRTPGFFGQTVAKTKNDGSIRYNKPHEQPQQASNASGQSNASSNSSSAQTSHKRESSYDDESLDELRKRLDREQGCVVDYTNCSPERKSYTVPKKYRKLQAIAPALGLETIKIHSEVALIELKNVRVSKAFIVEEGNAHYSSKDGILYDKPKTVLLRVPPACITGEFEIPSTVTIIANGAFSGSSIESLTVTCTVKRIGKSAFSYCKKLKSIYIPKSVAEIGEGAFEGDKSIQISTDAESMPSGWRIDETLLKKPIQWGVREP